MNTHANEQRFTRFIEYIRAHIRQELDIHRIAEAVHLSPWHWHRLYHDVMGETQHATLKWMRLHRAAWLLTYSDKTIADIARECGYGGNRQSFARTFRAAYGITPYHYRRQTLPRDYPVDIVESPAIPLIALEHHGEYQRLGDTLIHLQSLLHLRAHMPAQPRIFSLQYSDPRETPTDKLYALIAVAADIPQPETPLIAAYTPAGRYARLRHHGALAHIDRAFAWLYQNWLPQSGEQEHPDHPSIIEFCTDPRHTPAGEQYAELYLPLQQIENSIFTGNKRGL